MKKESSGTISIFLPHLQLVHYYGNRRHEAGHHNLVSNAVSKLVVVPRNMLLWSRNIMVLFVCSYHHLSFQSAIIGK